MSATANARKHMTKNPIKRAMLEAFTRKLVEEVVRLNPTSILDVGCGEGFVAAAILEQLPQVSYTGIDANPKAVTFAQTLNPQGTFSIGDIFHLAFENEQFDLVICSEVLEHVKPPIAALEELCRVSRGDLVLSVPHEPLFWGINLLTLNHITSLGNAPGHINHWNRGAFQRFLRPLVTVDSLRTSFPWILVRGKKKF